MTSYLLNGNPVQKESVPPGATCNGVVTSSVGHQTIIFQTKPAQVLLEESRQRWIQTHPQVRPTWAIH